MTTIKQDPRSAEGRRHFLCVLGAAGAVAAGVLGCGGGQPTTPFTAGAATDHPAGTFRLFRLYETVVARDEAGFYAFSSLCTHQGASIDLDGSNNACAALADCTGQSTVGTTTCAQHDSHFDANGNPTAGPANSTLPHFAVTVVGGVVHVDPGTTVAVGVRASA